MKKGWEILPFGDVCEISGGSQPPKDNFIYEPKEGYVRLVQVRDYRTDKYVTYIPKEMARKFCVKTDIMIGRYGPPIFGIFSGIEGAYNVALMKAIPDEKKLDKEFFRWFLKTDELVRFVERTSKRAAGQDGVRKERLYSYPTPIPPISEQQQIVSILDKAFAAIDQAKANTELNLQNAKDLFQSQLNQIFTLKGEGWVEKKLGEIGTLTSSKRIYKKEYVTEGIPFFRSKEIKELAHDKEISLELFITIERYSKIKNQFGIPKAGDILLTAVGTIGEMYVVKENDEFYFKDGNIMWLKNFDSLNTYYLKYALTSFVEQMKALTHGSAYNALTIEKLKEYKVPVPSIQKQNEIVKQLDELSIKTKKLEEKYHQKLINLEELKKSLLQKAFSGELTN
jgi:type I restriction enzyme, S subunit